MGPRTTTVKSAAIPPDGRERQPKSAWLDEGLRALAEGGARALRVEPLAARMNIARSSFYWHFPTFDVFRDELLAHWRERWTDDVVAEMDGVADAPARLRALLRRAFRTPRPLERALRAWAAEDAAVARAVAEVDERRIEYITKLLEGAGVPRRTARQRSTLVYWAFLGQPEAQTSALTVGGIDEVAALLAGKG
jgi:AcrR family transcriptional regulator